MTGGGALEQRVLSQAARVHAEQAELASLLVEFESTGEWRGDGIRSFGHWCDINIGMSARPAERLTAAARRLPTLPEVQAAFESGAVSVDKAVVVAEVATPATDGLFATMARSLTVSQLQRVCGKYRNLAAAEPDIDESEPKLSRRAVWSGPTGDGLVRIMALLEPDEAATVLAALDARVEDDWRRSQRSDDVAPPPARPERRADALVELAAEGLATGPRPVIRGEHVEVRVHVDAEVLAGTREDGVAELEGHGRIALAAIQRLACDAKVRAAVRDDTGGLRLGRTQRLVSRRQRQTLHHRDGGCRYPGCTNTRFVDAHHIRPWETGGHTDIDNLVLLCPTHHRLFHEHRYTIENRGAGELTFHRADGRVIAPPPLRPPPGRPPDPPGTPRAEAGGGRTDTNAILDGLLTLTG